MEKQFHQRFLVPGKSPCGGNLAYESNINFSFSNACILACMQYTHARMQSHALSNRYTYTHKITHSFRHKSASLPSRDDMQEWCKENKNDTVNYWNDKSVEWAIKFAIDIEHLVYSIMCVLIFTGNMGGIHTRPQNICFQQRPNEEHKV